MPKSLMFILFCLLLPVIGFSQAGIVEQVHDFGHVGIDFNLYHTFKYVNVTEKPVRILKTQSNCDCSTVKFNDSLLQPGDTGFFKLTFSTRDYYGPTNKSIKVITDNPQVPEINFFYLANVGQWFNGLKPRPISVFFLPGKTLQKIIIPNIIYDEIKILDTDKYDNIFQVKMISSSADKGKNIEIDISPDANLQKGTFHSLLTLSISTGKEKPVILSIPVKIVRY